MIYLSLFISYLLGSLPISILLSKFHGMPDPRSYGSCNIGATNIARKNKSLGLAVFLIDASKVLTAIMIANFLQVTENYWNLIWGACLFGQTCSIFLNFNGGKGVSCFISGILILYPSLVVPLAVASLISYLLTTYVWCASLTAVSIFFMFSVNFNYINMLIALWVIARHSSNIQQGFFDIFLLMKE